MRYYSCDSHVVEATRGVRGPGGPLRLAGAADRARLQGPAAATGSCCPTSFPIPVGRLGIAGNRLDDPATDERIAQGYDGLNPGVRDPHRRLDEQDARRHRRRGDVPVAQHVHVRHPRPRRGRGGVRAPQRLGRSTTARSRPSGCIGIGCLGLPDVEASLAEMQRAATRGVRGFAIPAHVDPDRPYCHPDYDPFWAAAQDFGVPLTMHIFTGSSLDGGLPDALGHAGRHDQGLHAGPHRRVINTMIDLICGGVVRALPPAQFVISEFETGWVAHFLQRLDHATYRTPNVRRRLPDDEAVGLLPAQLLRHVRGRRGRRAAPAT